MEQVQPSGPAPSGATPADDGKVTVNREVEVKLLAGPDGLQQVLKSPVLEKAVIQPRSRALVTTYYDTASGALQKAGIALRVRRNYGRFVMTVKFPPNLATGLFGRDEIEVRLPGETPDIDLFGDEIAGRIRAVTGGQPVEAAFTTNFRRRTGSIETGRATIEMAIDAGTLDASGRQQPIQEMELELKAGDEAALCDLAADLAGACRMRLGSLSKGERGSLLASGAPASGSKGTVPPLPPGIVVDDFIGAVIDVCLKQFTANWAAVEDGENPEGVHQARVSLRRLRAMLGLFAKRLPATEFQVFRAEAKQLASTMGPARDWDVFIDMVEKGPLKLYARDTSFEVLLEAAKARRDSAYVQARRVVTDPSTSVFVLNLRAFAARRGWRNALSGADLPILTQPARTYAYATLARMHKRALKAGRHLADLSIEERHELRIDLKKIRYAAEFFGPLFGVANGRKRYTRAAGGVQDALGAFNDEAVAHGLLETLEADCGPAGARAAGIVLGWCGRGRVDADGVLQPAWDRFAETKKFWD